MSRINPGVSPNDPALRATFVRAAAPTIVLFGDSRAANCDYSDATTSFSTSLDWFGYGQYAIPGGPVFEVVKNAGIGGNTTTQMLARFDADVLPYAPRAMTLWGGTNDGWTTTSDVDATVGRMAQIMAKASAAGIYVFLISETTASSKGTTFPNLVQYYNERLRAYAATHAGVEFWDFNAVIVNPTDTSGYPKAALLSDGLHPNAAGASAIGFGVVAGKLSRFKTSLAQLPTSVMDSKGNNANVLNVISNPLLTTTGGTLGAGDTGTVPGSWGTSGTPTAVMSSPARADGYGNDVQAQITAAAAAAKWINQTMSTTRLTAGGVYVIECAVDIVSPVNLAVVSATLQVTVGGVNYEFGVGKNSTGPGTTETLAAATGLVLRSRKFTIPAGSITGGTFVLTARFGAAGSATVRFGRIALKRVDNL